MDAGQDPTEGIFPFLGLIVSWLMAVPIALHFIDPVHSSQPAGNLSSYKAGLLCVIFCLFSSYLYA